MFSLKGSKALFFFLGILVLGGGIVLAVNQNNTPSRTDLTNDVGISGDNRNYAHVKVSSDGVQHVNTELRITTGIVVVHESFQNVPAPSTTSIVNATISTSSLLANGTSFLVRDIVQPGIPRNIVAIASFPFQSATTPVTMTMVVYGTAATGGYFASTETITITTTTATGKIAWAYISKFDITVSSVGESSHANVRIQIGNGYRIGLANRFESTSDVFKVVENSLVHITSAAIDTQNWTLHPPTLPNGAQDYDVWYKATRSVPSK